MGLSEAEELELLELEEMEYQASKAKTPKDQQTPEASTGQYLQSIASPVLKGLDYAGGIARTGVAHAVDAFTEGDNVTSEDTAKAFRGEAPGSAEYMERLGVPEGARVNLMPEITVPGTDIKLGEGDSSLRDVGGFAMDVATDPLTYGTLGLAAVAKKPLKAFAKTAASNTAKGAKVGADTAGNVLSKTGEALTAAPRRSIEVYANRTDELNKLFKEYADDTAEFSDSVKAKINSSIQSTKNNLNKSIDEALEAMPDVKSIDPSFIKEELVASKAKLNKVLDEDAVGDIDEFIKKIDDLSENGRISLKDLNAAKQYFQGQAKSAYMKQGQMFSRSKRGQQAAKAAARVARKQLNTISPDIAKANNSLARLHGLEDAMNKNIIKEGGSSNALITAGSGANQRNRRHLKELSDITGKDIVRDAENVAAFDTFAKPDLLPRDSTGKSAARIGAAYMLGGIPAAVMTSPMALKVAINAGKIPKNILKHFGGGSGGVKNANKVFDAITSASGKKRLADISKAARIMAVHGRRGKAASLSGGSKPENQNKDFVASLKGENKWAFDGYLNLIDQDKTGSLGNEAQLKKIFSSAKGRNLLIAASSAKTQSAKEKILNKLRANGEKI